MSTFIELPLPKTLDTSTADIIADFFVPLLVHATRYDRGVGFFSAAWLRIAAEGMVAFAHNSGRARWVTSPILSEEDWQALQLGEAARHDGQRRDRLTTHCACQSEAKALVHRFTPRRTLRSISGC
jgi:hypothetical protein